MKAESLYIQKLTYDENTGNEIIGLFPSEANPAIVSSYTYDAKRMGGAPTLTATIYSSEPLQWKKEEFVEYNGDRFFASYTPNSTKDNSSRMWKSEITFTSRRELLDNTLFFDVVVDDVDTQNKDRYRSNQTKFTFGGTIHEFVARINSSMAYCGLYRPTDVYKGYYVVVDEGYGTDEVKEVSFEDQYLTDVLQLINTTFELDYYWDGNVCHVGKVQHDLTDTPIKYGSSDALISVSKENANYKIVDMITGYGSSDNLPYYYPNDDEFGEAVFNTENIIKDKVSVELSKFLKDSRYNDTLVLYKSKEEKSYTGSIDVSPPAFYIHSFTYPENLSQADSQSNPTVMCDFTINIPISAIKGQKIDLTNLNFSFELFNYIQRPDFITNVSNATKSIFVWKKGEEQTETISKDVSFGSISTYTFKENGDFTLQIVASFTYNSKVFNSDGRKEFYGASVWNVAFGGSVEFSYKPKSEYEWKNGDKYIPYSDAGINVSVISEANCIEYDYQFVKDGDRYGFNKVYTGTEDNAVKVMVTDRVWIAPSSVLMPSIYRNTKGAERFYYALNNTHKLQSGSGYYEFVNLYKKGNPHQGTVTFDDIKPTINGIVNAEGQLFGEIADVAFDKEDSDVKDSDGNYIHSYFYIKLHKFNGDFGFDLFAHALASEPAKINLIKSNGCPACSFVIYNQPSADNSKCYNCVSVDENGNLKPVRTDKNDYIFANASDAYEDKLNQDSTQKELWIAVQKDTSTLGIIMPNASAGFKPQKGDLFVITGIKPPKVLVTAAEKRLDDALIKHMSENNTDQFNYSVKFSRIFLQENPDFASKLNENAKLSIQIQGDSDSDGNLISHEVFVSNYSVKVDNDELAEVEIELVNSLEVTKSDTKQIIDAVKGETVKSLSSMVGGSNTNSFNASITDKMYLSKLKDDTANGTITFQKVQKFLQGLLVGGGSWTPDAEGRSHLITDYLEVRMKAIFEELVINKTSTIGGKEIISPAGGVVAHKVEEVTVTYNNVSQKAYRCYFLAEQDGDKVDNDFAVNDQVRSESFNVRKGTYHKAGNHFYWRLVIGRDEDPVELEGKKYHYIDLSDTDCATASDVPAKGDVLNQCGNRTDVERQNCLIFSAVDTYSPSISLYHGINSYSFANREYVEYGVNKQTNKAFFHVYGDMYVGDRPTKENGYEGSSYIRYDSSTKQLSVKGKISAKSTVDGKELSQYIKENTDDTVANAAKKAAEDAQKAAQTAQTDIKNLGKTVTDNKKEFDNYVTDGYLEPSEIAAMAQDSKRLEDDFAAAQKSYNEVKEAEVLANTKELTDLNTAFATLTSAKTELVTYLSDISTNYNKADTTGKAAIVSAVGTKFTNFQSAYSAFYDKLGLANAYITSKIYGDLKQNITDLAGYKYLKDALGQTTDIDGGLVMTTLLALRDGDGNVQSGINGAIDPNRGKKSIATWWGGQMVDKDYNSGNLTPATSLIRFDGSGYLANGAIWWDVSGKVHADPTSFIISEKNLGAYLTFFEPTWKEGSAGTSVADLVSLKPNAPFSKLGVSGDATFEGTISFHGIKLTYDSKNKAIKIDGNLYTTGGITAYGAGASTTGGGGLIASVISYARIIEGNYTDADLTSIPNAYAIKALSSRIDNIASELGGLSLSWNNITGKPSTFTPSAHTHKWTEITDRITKVSQLTNDKGYLTAHQSLASYYTKAEIDAKGYTTNKGTVTSVALTLPTGLTCATKTITTSGTFAISLASGYSIPTTAKQTAWDGAVSAKHTHSNKSVLDGITSTKVTCWDSAYDWYALITTDEETADGVINKWNEVVSFLANIAQTDTLSGIVDGINKSISDEVTRAKKAEGVNASGISTNKTSITTLQGYFTSGSAKKAIQLTNTHKLWGNSFNGTADINGSIIVPSGKYISIGNIKLEYDATNKALKITNTTTNEVANLYTSGGVSAYGVGTSSSSGGGLNGSVKSYSDALKLTSESLSEIASAYSIKALASRISSLEGGSATSIETTGSGNAVTSVSKSGTKITFTKGSTFSLNGHTHTFASLTSKPTSLSGYGITDGVNAVSVTGSGNAVTAASVSGHTLTLTKGSTFSLSNHTHYVGTTQVQGSSAEQALTGITKIDNILKLSKATVTVNTSYKAEQNRLVIYGNTYGNDANYIKSAGKLSYGDGGPQLVFSTSENPDASGVQSAALVYTDHDTIGAGASLSFVTNQGDAYFIAPHIKALTAFQGNLAWSYITNKPTTLSGFGITDGLRSVTHPSGSNVFVTGISTSGTAITYTKSYTKKSLSAVGTSGWTNASIDGNIIPDMSFIAYWNGAYSGTSSNLAYCNKGAFGSFAIKNSLAFSELTSKPTTISGYGITDAYTKSQVDAIAAKYLPLTGGTLTGQLKIVASALNGAYNGLLIGDDCYIGDCNFGNTIGLMGVGNNNAGMVKFGKGGMQFGYNGSNHIASTTAQWTNLNADLLDGWHKYNIVWSGAVNSNTASLSHYWAKLFDITVTGNQYDDRNFTFLFSNGYNDTYSVVVLRIRQNGAKDSGAYDFSISLRELVGNMSSRLRVYYNNATGNVQLWGNCQCKYGSLSYTIIKKTGRTSADFTSQGTLVTNTSFSAAQSLPATTGDSPYTLLDGATRIGIVKQADQLVTARTIWGQSFNGTANVSGALSGATTISASNTISTTLQNGALKIGNKLTPISAIDAQVIFNTGAAIRFGETNWDYNQWAGLKYTHSNKTIYLGIADNSVFNANSAQSNGTLKFPGITTITPDGGARIGGSGGDLYLGNANNFGFVKVQDMCSQVNSSYWSITQLGSATFKSLTVNDVISCDSISVSKNAVIAGNLSVNGLINNKGILPTNYEVNNKGEGCYVSADALCSGITAITDSIPVTNVDIHYSNDNGTNWTKYEMSDNNKFKLYANVPENYSIELGNNVITGNNDAEKLAQVKKNQSMFTFEVLNNCYSQIYFASVDMSNGIHTICTVEFINSNGVITNTFTKLMTGWNQFNYINLSNGNEGVPVGNDNRRYIRFKFKHDQNTTALRNASINRIRIFAFTKYSFPTDRFMGHTGHIYNFDYNMNTYFPNSILAKGGVTAYQSSDIRLKQDLRKLDYLGIIKAMGGTYGFAWKKDNTRSIGWIAQHVLCNPHLKDIVETDEKGYYKINYWSPKLIATAFGAIEQVGDEVSRLKARVVFLESEVLRLSGDKEDCNKKRLDNKNINLLN